MMSKYCTSFKIERNLSKRVESGSLVKKFKSFLLFINSFTNHVVFRKNHKSNNKSFMLVLSTRRNYCSLEINKSPCSSFLIMSFTKSTSNLSSMYAPVSMSNFCIVFKRHFKRSPFPNLVPSFTFL